MAMIPREKSPFTSTGWETPVADICPVPDGNTPGAGIPANARPWRALSFNIGRHFDVVHPDLDFCMAN